CRIPRRSARPSRHRSRSDESGRQRHLRARCSAYPLPLGRPGRGSLTGERDVPSRASRKRREYKPDEDQRQGKTGLSAFAFRFATLHRLLAFRTQIGSRNNAQPLHSDRLAAPLTAAEAFRVRVQPTQRLIDPVQALAVLAGQEELLLPLHRFATDVGHVEPIGAQLPCLIFQRLLRRLLEGANRLQRTLALTKQELLDSIAFLLGQHDLPAYRVDSLQTE